MTLIVGRHADQKRRDQIDAQIGRFLALGWNHEPPSRWVAGLGVDGRGWVDLGQDVAERTCAALMRAWDRSQARPDIIGSCYNRTTPKQLGVLLWATGSTQGAERLGSHADHLLKPCADGASSQRRRIEAWWRLTTDRGVSMRELCLRWVHAPRMDRGWREAARIAQLSPAYRLWCARFAGHLPREQHPKRIRELAWLALPSWIEHAAARARLKGAGIPACDWWRLRDLPERYTDALGGLWRRGTAAGDPRALRYAQKAILNHWDGLEPDPRTGSALLSPTYPAISTALGVRLALGERPVDFAPGLTSAEAHRWLMAGAPDPGPWLADRLDLPGHRSSVVVRWLERVRQSGRWNAIERERVAPLPGGQRRTFRALDILDEIDPEDIMTGSDSVTAVLRRASERLGEAYLTRMGADHRTLCPMPSWASTLPRWCRVLRTPAQLVSEGRNLDHCVGAYSSSVESGRCIIVSVRSRHGRSTAELSADGRSIRQHRGPGNGSPPKRHETLIQAIVNRIFGRRPAGVLS